MTDMPIDPTNPDHAARARAAMEQDAAAMQERDTQNWENHLEVHRQNIDHAKSMAERNRGIAATWRAVAQLLHTSALVLFVAALCWVLGWGPF